MRATARSAGGPPRGLGVYRDVMSAPGAAVFVPAGVLARLPISMLGIAIVLLVQGAYGSYALAGAVAAVYAVVSALCSPLVARAVDRHGQALVMRPAIAVHLLGMAALIAAVGARAPAPVLVGAAALMGATIGSVGALVRARWAHVLTRADTGPADADRSGADRDAGGTAGTGQHARPVTADPDAADPAPGAPVRRGDRLSTAFSLESVLDEVVFATGPVIVTTVAAAVAPAAALAVAGLAVAVGGAVLLAQRSSEPPPTRAAPVPGARVLSAPGMPLVVAVFVAAGAAFGSVEVVAVAFTDAAGVPWAAGLLLAGYALGSLVAGLVYGTVDWRARVGRRFAVGSLGFAVGVGSLAVVGHVEALSRVGVLGAVLFVAGSAISPMLIAGTALVRDLVPPARLTEGLTWVATSLGLGVAAGAAGAGRWVEDAGAGSALSLPALCGAAVVVVVLTAGRAHLRAGDRQRPG